MPNQNYVEQKQIKAKLSKINENTTIFFFSLKCWTKMDLYVKTLTVFFFIPKLVLFIFNGFFVIKVLKFINVLNKCGWSSRRLESMRFLAKKKINGYMFSIKSVVHTYKPINNNKNCSGNQIQKKSFKKNEKSCLLTIKYIHNFLALYTYVVRCAFLNYPVVAMYNYNRFQCTVKAVLFQN